MTEKRSHVISTWWGLSVFALGIFFNIIIQISPTDAVSNVSKWVEAFGVRSPKWLEPAHADRIVRMTGICLMIIGAVWAAWPILRIIVGRSRVPVPAVPADRLDGTVGITEKTRTHQIPNVVAD